MADKKRAFEHTSYEVRQRWDKENIQRYVVSLHKTNDSELIKKVEANKHIGTTQLFREALECYFEAKEVNSNDEDKHI